MDSIRSNGLDMDHTGPVEIWCEGGKLEPVRLHAAGKPARGDALMSRDHRVRMRYANGIEVRLEDNGPAAGGEFIGDRGKIRIGNDEVTSNPPELAQTPAQDLKVRLPAQSTTTSRIGSTPSRPGRDRSRMWRSVIARRSSAIWATSCGGSVARCVGIRRRRHFRATTSPICLLDRPRRAGYELPSV